VHDPRDPWTVLREDHPELVLVRAPIGARGRYYNGRKGIVVRDDLLIVQERAALWHEIVHARRGDQPCSGRDLARMELSCRRDAAKLAISIEALADALLWSDCEYQQADELKTIVEYVRIRKDPRNLHPSERGFLKRRLAMKEHTA